jgi:indole-3-glycerol phosphate synthase
MYLDRIVVTKLDEVKQLKQKTTREELELIISKLPPTRGFEMALRHPNRPTMGIAIQRINSSRL